MSSVQWVRMHATLSRMEVADPSLGLIEHFHAAACDLGIDSCVVASAQYSSVAKDDSATPSDAQLRFALAQMIAEQPALGAQLIVNTSGVPTFVRLRSIDLSHAIEYAAPTVDVQEAFRSQLCTSFQAGCERPLWRVMVLKDGHILFAYHHAIADGQSGVSFHMALLKALNGLPDALEDPPTVVDLTPTTNFLPPIEKLTSTRVSLRTLSRETYGLLAPQSLKPGRRAWTGNPVAKVPTVVTIVDLWYLSPADAARLLGICREQKCTLTGFIHTLCAEAFSRVLATHAPEVLAKCKSICTITAVSLRRYSGTPIEIICDQPSAIQSYVRITRSPGGDSTSDSSSFPPFPFAKAVKFSGKLHAKLHVACEEVGALWYLFGRLREYFQGKLGKKRQGTFTLSNIGRFPSPSPSSGDGDTLGRWKVGEMYFGQCDSTVGAAIKINVVGGGDGSVTATFTRGESSLDEKVAKEFIRVVKEWTQSVLASS